MKFILTLIWLAVLTLQANLFPKIKEEDIREATYAMVYTKYKQGVSRAVDDKVARKED